MTHIYLSKKQLMHKQKQILKEILQSIKNSQ